uniref:GPI ethanolamine phosphate transferase 3, catalytic subunit n=1 Tax=Glossina austeni TaxID=7395 RepID=A0A1A9UR96_GLOAU
MEFAVSYGLTLIWLTYLIASGVILFSRGFLLSRVSKTDVSNCRQLSLDINDKNYLSDVVVQEIFKDVNATTNLCLPQKSKVIILLIDALKYEFGVYKENLTKPLAYENKLSVMYELEKDMPEYARLMVFKADPPTTTLQRLKGLTTGSLPTFVDIGSNFASPEINEDNIIDQINNMNLPIVFMGDSTWADLYPRRFLRSYPYPSFDIFDLDTIDRGVQRHLSKEMMQNDWQVLIAHFLGVDHCGHKHGPLHDEMGRKLNEMNNVIRDIVAQMDNQTTLFVIGDHGMTATGDHGGDTDDETNALLFAYTKRSKFLTSEFGSDANEMQQIDFVPTLAAILGVPIPYSNLGLINFNVIPNVIIPNLSKLQTILLHVWQNAQQIYKYFYNYALENKRTFTVEHMESLETEFILLTHRVKTIYNTAAFKSFVGDLNKHLRQILSTSREIWVKFDATQMSQGLIVTFLPIFFTFVFINNTRSIDLYKIFTFREIGYTYLLNIAAGVFGYRYHKNFSFKSEEHAIIFFTSLISTLVFVFHTVQNWSAIAHNWSKMTKFAYMPTRAILGIALGVFFSNSFIIHEAKILSYLLVATILLMIYELLQKSAQIDFRHKFRISVFLKSTTLKLIIASFLAITLIRFASSLFRCREEQGNCIDFSSSSSNADSFIFKKASSSKVLIVAVIVVVLYTTLTRLYLRLCGNLTGNSVNVLLARYGPTIASICTGGHMLLTGSAIKNIQRSHIDIMALIIYALLALQVIVITIAPLMVFVLPPKNCTTIAVNTANSIVPEIFKKMKRMYEGGEVERQSDIPVVYGLATVYSSILISFGIFLTMVIVILLEPYSSVGAIICVAIAAALLSIHSILRFKTAISFETCIQPNFNVIVAWFLLAHFCFFATSHQTTLSQIDWRSAFVGRTASIGQSNFISGILVILNTFCGQILFFSLYGLLATQTFSIFALFPSLIKSNSNRETRKSEIVSSRLAQQATLIAEQSLSDISIESVGFDMSRGELVLFERETVFLGTMFKLATQLFMLQGFKVFCSMLACTIHCRHLMVWKIFAPRFIYESLATFVSMPAIVIGYFLIFRIHKAVDNLINKINKIK